MLRGCQRRVIHLKDPKSQLFDEVYFIVREQNENQTPASFSEMMKEAHRIIKDNLPEEERIKRARRRVWSLVGVSFGLGVSVSVLFLLLFF